MTVRHVRDILDVRACPRREAVDIALCPQCPRRSHCRESTPFMRSRPCPRLSATVSITKQKQKQKSMKRQKPSGRWNEHGVSLRLSTGQSWTEGTRPADRLHPPQSRGVVQPRSCPRPRPSGFGARRCAAHGHRIALQRRSSHVGPRAQRPSGRRLPMTGRAALLERLLAESLEDLRSRRLFPWPQGEIEPGRDSLAGGLGHD